MMVPVRCFSCGKVIGHLYEDFAKAVAKGTDPSEAMDKLGLKRYCCRRMILSHKEYIDEIIKYKRF